MKCPECVAAGQRSIVHDRGGSTTLLGWSPYYDEDGKYHSHDPNTHTRHYSCSNGHSWQESRKLPCVSCEIEIEEVRNA